MRKRSMTILAAAALAASLTVGGCGSKSPEAGGKFGGEKDLTLAPSTEAETEAETEPELDEETIVIPFSAEKGTGREELLSAILSGAGVS